MPDNFPTLADKIADALDLSDAEVSDLVNAAPFVAMLPAEESSNGTMHAYSKEIGAPVVGFREVNKGRSMSSSQDERVEATLEIMDWSYACDKAFADTWRRGGPQAWIAREGLRHIKAALFGHEQQIIGGTVHGSSAGFLGFADIVGLQSKTATMVLDATGTVAGEVSSVYAVCVGPNDIVGVYKGDGSDALDAGLGETIVQNWKDSEGLNFPAYYTPASTHLGLQVGGAYSIARLVNLTAETNKTLDDDMLADLISKFPIGRKPTHYLMNRRSLAQLRKSRTATNATGAPAPFPTEAHGIPIVPVESITSTEPLIA